MKHKKTRVAKRKSNNNSQNKILSLFFLLLTFIALPLMLFLIRQRQNAKQYAMTSSSTTNLLQNPSFENTGNDWLLPWNLAVNTTGSAAAEISQDIIAADGISSAKIIITQNSSVPYDIQLRQNNMTIQTGDLVTCSFWAKADNSRTIDVALQQGYNPYTVYTQQTFNLVSDWRVYSLAFAANTIDTNMQIAFNLAQSTGTVWVDKTKCISAPGIHNLYYGLHVPGGLNDFTNLTTVENDAQKKAAIVMWYQGWGITDGTQNFQTAWMNNVRNHGSLPLVTWEPWDYTKGVNQPAYSLKNIINGKFDAYITKWAMDSKAWGHPYFLRFAHEMNGNWYPWSEQVNGNRKGDYIKAWKHVRNIFTLLGVKNITWVWSPNISFAGTIPMQQVYPGDSYVDWVGLDGYNWGTVNNHSWQFFDTVFGQSYTEITLLTAKPLMIAETASAEQGGWKADWINDAYTYKIPYLFPKVKAVIWFNENKETDWRIESSPATQASFSDAIKEFIYQSNAYASQENSPIPAP